MRVRAREKIPLGTNSFKKFAREAYMKANWSLEVEESKVQELDKKVEETQKTFGIETMMMQHIEERYGGLFKEL